MGLLSNDKLLKEIYKYLDNTDFTIKEIGHRLAMTFLPSGLEKKIGDNRYSFNFQHKLLNKRFVNETYGGLIVNLVMSLNSEINSDVKLMHKELYEEVGLIENNRCTMELISNVIANGIAINPGVKSGNTSKNIKRTDNLQLIFPEFNENTILYFLKKVDNYKPTN